MTSKLQIGIDPFQATFVPTLCGNYPNWIFVISVGNIDLKPEVRASHIFVRASQSGP